jgi:cobalt-zinc-cadmium efflux system outer membrane protein
MGAARVGVFVLALALAPFPAVFAQTATSPQSIQGHVAEGWTLEDAVSAALTQHPLVDAARARVEAARGERAGVGAIPNPVGTLWLENAAYPGQRTPAGFSHELSWYVGIPLEPLFQRVPRIRRADEEIGLAQATLMLARRTVAAEVTERFFAVALAQALHEEAAENRLRLDQLVAYNRVRVGEGVTAERELLRLEVELERAANDVIFADVELMRARARLAPYVDTSSEMARFASLRAAVPPSGTVTPAMLPDAEGALALARARRPEIAAGRARAAAATASVDYERSLTVRQAGATFGNKQTGGVNSMIAGLSVTIPVFNQNRGAVARATNEQIAANHELAWAERLVACDLQASHATAVRLTTQLNELQRTFVARAATVHDLTLGAYHEGGATLLQVLDATRMLAEAHLAYSRTLFAQRASLFRLALAIGSEPLDALHTVRNWSTAPLVADRAGDLP